MPSAPRRHALAVVTSLVALAVFARTRTVARVLVGDAALPLDTDAHYHLRRALRTLHDFPHVPRFDPLFGWPEGSAPTWPPGFDQLLALPAWIAGLRGDPTRAAQLMVYVPVALGVALVLVTRDLARRAARDLPHAEAIGWSAGALCAVLPQAVATTAVGSTDHHGAEALLAALTLRWLLAWEPDAALPALRRWELAGAALFFAGVHTYCGAVLFAGVALGLVAVAVVLRPEAPRALAGTGAPAAFGAAALLLVVDGSWIAAQPGWFHPLQLSLTQPSLLALAGAATLGAALAARQPTRAARARALLAAGLAVAGLGAHALARVAPARAAVADRLLGWLGHRDPWMDAIAEVRPLFDRAPTTLHDWRRALAVGGTLVAALPVTLVLAVAGLRGAPSHRRLFFAGYTLALAAATLLQTRFGRPLVSALAASAALGLAYVAALASRRAPRLAPAVLVALTVAWAGLDPRLRVSLETPPATPPSTIADAALYLRAHPVAPTRGHGAGVFAPWDRSNEILQVSGRPVVHTSFGPYVTPTLYRDGERAWRGDGEGLNDFMARADAGHVVTGLRYYLKMRDARGGAPLRELAGGASAPNPAFLRAQPAALLWLGGGGLPDEGIAHARHFLPVFASSEAVPRVEPAMPALWVYERVAGARIVGAAPSGARVTAVVTLVVRGVPRPWVAWTVAARDRFELIVPLPTALRAGVIRTAERYTVQAGGRAVGAVEVSLDAVRAGATVAVTPSPDG